MALSFLYVSYFVFLVITIVVASCLTIFCSHIYSFITLQLWFFLFKTMLYLIGFLSFLREALMVINLHLKIALAVAYNFFFFVAAPCNIMGY